MTAESICIAGKNQVAVDVLREASSIVDVPIAALPLHTDRGMDGWQPSLLKAAEELGYTIVDIDWVKRQPNVCFLSLEYDKIIKPAEFSSSKLFNLHFSLLPKYRGCHTAIWPILNGETHHGVTLHEIDPGIDTGPIIAQQSFEIGNSTSRDIYFQCMELGSALTLEWLPRLLSGAYPRIEQDPRDGSLYMRRQLDFARKELNFNAGAEEVLRYIRAFTFAEYQLPTYGQWQVVAAEIVSRTSPAAPGSVLERGEGYAILATRDHAVHLTLCD